MKLQSLIAVITLGATISACAPPYRAVIPLDPAAQVKIPDSTVLVEEPKEKIVFQYNVPQTTGLLGGGLLFVLIDAGVEAGRKNEANRMGKPIEEALAGIDLADEIKKRLAGKITQINWIDVKGTESGPAASFEAAKKDGDKPFVHIAVTPSIDPTFSALDFKLLLEVYQKAPVPHSVERNPVYRWTWQNTITGIEGGKDIEKNIALWVSEDGKMIRDAYMKGIEIVIQKILIALEDPTSIPS